MLRRKGRARGIELPKGSGCNGEGGGCGACAQADEKMRMKQNSVDLFLAHLFHSPGHHWFDCVEMRRVRPDSPGSPDSPTSPSFNAEAPTFRLPPTMQNIAAFVQQVFSSSDVMEAASSNPAATLARPPSTGTLQTRGSDPYSPKKSAGTYEAVFTAGGDRPQFLERSDDVNKHSSSSSDGSFPFMSSTTFSIGGAPAPSINSRQGLNVGRGGKSVVVSIGGALSRTPSGVSVDNTSSDDGVEPSVARLDLQSGMSPQKTANRDQTTKLPVQQPRQQQPKQQQQQQQQQQKQQQPRDPEGGAGALVPSPKPGGVASAAPDTNVCKFGDACVCLARGHNGRTQGLSCKYGLHTKQEWRDAQSKLDQAETAAAAEKTKQRNSTKAAISVAEDAQQRIGSKAPSQDSGAAASAPQTGKQESQKPTQHQHDRQQDQPSKKKQEQQQPKLKSSAKLAPAPSPAAAAEDSSAASLHVCGLCASGYSVVAVHPCGHRDICAKCDLKMRTVVNDRRCCFCKNATETVIYAAVERRESYKELLLLCHESNSEWAAVFDSLSTRDAVHDLIALGCPVCGTKFADETSLKTHVKSVHRLQYCSVCLEQRTALLCEQSLYSEVDYKSHMLAHPKCRFCRMSFLDDDKLFTHMERSHLRCHLCHQAGQVYQYFTNLDSFRVHCSERHFVCSQPECNIDQCRVFASAVELADHELDHKAGSVSRSERSRVLQVAFWGATGAQPSFVGEEAGRQRGGRSRGGNGARDDFPANGPAASAASESGEQWPGLGGIDSASGGSMASAYPQPVTRHELDCHFPALPGSEGPPTPERHRRSAAERGGAAASEVPWVRDMTRPLSPFGDMGVMMKRNKDLGVR